MNIFKISAVKYFTVGGYGEAYICSWTLLCISRRIHSEWQHASEPFSRDTCNWKRQLERTRNWKFISWKLQNEIGKIEVGKFEPKLERLNEVRKLLLNSERSIPWIGIWNFKLSNFSPNFPTAAKLSNSSETFQLQKKHSNFGRFFPTSLGSFQLRLALSNLNLSNMSIFPSAISNYTYPL